MKKFFTLTLLAMLGIAASAYDFGAATPYSYTVFDSETHQMVTRTDVSHMIYYAINPDGKTVTVVEGPETYVYDYVCIPEQVVNPDDGKTYTVKAIGANAFSCSELIEIVLANTIEEIQESAFSGSSVVNVYFPTGLKYVRDNAFSGAWQLLEVYLHDGLLSIGSNAFSTCGGPCHGNWMYCSTALQSVRLPESATTIRDRAFSGNKSLVSINLPMNLKEIEEGLLAGCSSLQEIVLPTALEKIHGYAFEGAGLTSIEFPSKLKEIEEYAFSSTDITELTLPATLQIVGEGAFQYCTSLTEATVNYAMKELPDKCFEGCISLQKATINTNITLIGANAFSNCEQLVNVTLPNSLTEIGYSAFSYCKRLSGITLSNNVDTMGDDAFAYSGLTRFTFPTKLTYISERMFQGCEKLTTFTVPSTINEIRESAFSYCTSLRSISLPETITSLPNNCFNGCSALTNINIPSKVTEMGGSCFACCASLASITLPDALVEMGDRCFYGCSKLTSITIPNKVTKLNENTFSGCLSLLSVDLPSEMIEIHQGVFDGCEKLPSITLPESLQYISLNSFNNCTKLTTVNLPTGFVPDDNYYGRLEVPNSITLYIPKGTKAEYENHEGWSLFNKIAEKDYSSCLYKVEKEVWPEYGTILVNGNGSSNFMNGDYYKFKAAKGSEVKVEVVPDERYLVRYSLLCNGVDVTASMTDNIYTIQNIQENKRIETVWEEGTPNGCQLLTAKNTGSQGGSSLLVDGEQYSQWSDEESNPIFKFKTGSNITLTVCPDEEYLEKYTLFVNGVDVTSQVVDNEYVIKNIQSETLVEVVFEPGAPNGYNLVTSNIERFNGYTNIFVNDESSSRWYDEQGRYQFKFKTGDDVKITIAPDESYLEKYTLYVNGADVTSSVVDDEYTIKNISSDMLVEAVFEDGAPNGYHLVTTSVPESDGTIYVNNEYYPYYNTWYDSENRPRFKVKAGSDVAISLESSYFEWPQYTLYANGNDVSAQVMNGEYTIKNIQEDVLLEAWFQEGVPTGIDGISEMEAGQTELYNLQGQRVEKPIAGHIYVTKDGKKIVVRKNTK